MQEDWSITLSVLESPDTALIGQQKVFYTSPISIGRAENNDMVLPDPTISRNHAILRITSDYTRVFITDMSTHGTEVSGRAVPRGLGSGFTIESGENIRIGDTLIRYDLQLKPSVQATMVGKFDTSILDLPSDDTGFPFSTELPAEIPQLEAAQKGFSPLALTIIGICLVLMFYLVFFVD